MKTTLYRTSMLLAAASICLLACEPPPGDDLGVTEGELVGTETTTRPEIAFVRYFKPDGTLEFCTASLIHPLYAVTAGHCSKYQAEIARQAELVIKRDGRENVFAVDRIDLLQAARGHSSTASYGLSTNDTLPDGRGNNDVAVWHLTTPVSANLATPATISGAFPASGALITGFGAGCNDRTRLTGSGPIRYGTFPYAPAGTAFIDDKQVTCPGDSGGPIVKGSLSERGDLFASWSASAGWGAHIGHVAWLRRAILRSLLDDGDQSLTSGTSGFELTGIVHSTVALSGTSQQIVDACRARCASNGSHCEGFTASWATSSCTLYRAVEWFRPHPGAASGLHAKPVGGSSAEWYVDRPGPAYDTINVAAQVSACRDACARDERCASFTYAPVPYPGTGATCALKDAVYPAVYRNGVASGVRSGVFRGGAVASGSTLRTFAQTAIGKVGIEACQAACARDGNCSYWTWRPRTTGAGGTAPSCSLHADVSAVAGDDSRVYSGRRNGEFVTQHR